MDLSCYKWVLLSLTGRAVFSSAWERTEDERKIAAALEKVAKEVGAQNITSGKHHNSFVAATLCANRMI